MAGRGGADGLATKARRRDAEGELTLHANYSDGKDHACFGGLVTVPSTWEEARNKKVLSSRKKRRISKKPLATAAKPKASPTKRIYNLETGEFEEVISIDE